MSDVKAQIALLRQELHRSQVATSDASVNPALNPRDTILAPGDLEQLLALLPQNNLGR